MSWRSCRSIDTANGLGQEILQRNPGATLYYVGDTSHQTSGKYPNSGASDHNPDLPTSDGCPGDIVCAIDIMTSGGPNCDQLAEHIRQRVLAGEQRPKYLIWSGRIFSGHGQDYVAGQWRTYGGSNGHYDHIHLSIRHGPNLHDNNGSWGWTEPLDTLEVDVPIFVNLDSGQTLLVMSGVVSIGSDNDRKELLAACKDIDHIAKVGGGTAKQLAGMAGHA